MGTNKQEHFYLRANDEEECWELLEYNAIHDEELKESAVIARFYSGNASRCALAELVKLLLNNDYEMNKEKWNFE